VEKYTAPAFLSSVSPVWPSSAVNTSAADTLPKILPPSRTRHRPASQCTVDGAARHSIADMCNFLPCLLSCLI